MYFTNYIKKYVLFQQTTTEGKDGSRRRQAVAYIE